ncbi:MAG: YbgC/FadM family acyl-CoA thioesterase [Kiritimatiellae bacterium]|nr:YbgC/FadM family acyl-CoA thioesterase [Kiritimatiellia bacterium]
MKISMEYRVPYADTDQMGVVYYGNYLTLFERARNELMRSIGYTYRECEAEGWMLPVVHAEVDYSSPARYDDLLEVTAYVRSRKGVRIEIACEVRRKGEERILASGFTRHCFVSTQTFRPVPPPKRFLEACGEDVGAERGAGLAARTAMLAMLALPLLGATVRPEDNGSALVNPGMGFTMHYYSNDPRNYGSTIAPGDSLEWFPGCSVCYLRLPWAFVEPEEGVFDWAALDTPAQRWIERGGQVAFRITCSEDWLEYAVPEWVVKAGAKGCRWDWPAGGQPTGAIENGRLWDPDFADPVFLDRLERFIAAIAGRYDGRPEVAFVDIGSYGLWGEGHTGASSNVPQERMDEEVKLHVDLYAKYFKSTPLVISDDVSGAWDKSGYYPLLDYARGKGVGWRDDSILVQPPPLHWFHEDQAARYWRSLPVVLEHGHYRWCVDEVKSWSGDLLLEAVEKMHASYMSIHGDPRRILDENRETVDRINRRIGYRFNLVEATWPDRVFVGENAEEFEISWSWANAGVAPPYADAFPCLTVKDDAGGIMAVVCDDRFNLRFLDVGGDGSPPVAQKRLRVSLGRHLAPTFAAGTYDVYVSVGKPDGTPLYALAYDGGDGHRRYPIGKIEFAVR